jgi:hypothetical protein
MKLKLLSVALVAVVAIPLATQGAEGQTAPKEKRYCEVTTDIGSRLGGTRRCRTKSERAAAKAESAKTVERIQSQKNFTEAMWGARTQCSGGRGC